MAKVYTLSGYPEEVIAHAFAKTSRSPGSFQDMINELTQDQSDAFHSKWVLEYGHNSIAEHAVIHLAVEDVSRIAMAALENGRLASYTEQSTRYQVKTSEHVFIDDSWEPEFVADYRKVCGKLFAVYDRIHALAKEHGKKLGFTGYDFARFVLPLGTKVNTGITINARSLRRTLCKMLASELPEVVSLAQQIKDSALKVAPTLLRHVKPCPITQALYVNGQKLNLTESPPVCNNLEPIAVTCNYLDTDIQKIIAGLSYEYSDLEWTREKWIHSPLPELFNMFDQHASIPRAFEENMASFEIVSDYGSFYDMKRHRMASLLTQHKTLGKMGYIVPGAAVLEEINVLQEYLDAMETVNIYATKWMHLPEHIYFYPNAYRIRYKMSMNLRELIEIIKLRGINKHGHTSYRCIGLKMLELAQAKCPDLFSWMNKWLTTDDTSKNMLKDYQLMV